jgi:2-oxoglutarate ferredoxin oxidoreductase subunit alpha
MQKLLVNECAIDPSRFISILHYDGTPITARFITAAIDARLGVNTPRTKEAAE